MPSLAHRHRILYVGNNYALLTALQDGLSDLSCHVVRCPAHGVPEARLFIESEILYTLFLFDEVLTGASGEELARFAISRPHRAGTPVLIVKEADGVMALVERARRLMDQGARRVSESA